MKSTLLLVNIVGLLIGTAYGMHVPILPVFNKNVIGASYTDLGLVGLADALPYTFIPIFVGFLLYRYNSGHLLSIGIMINSASIFLLSYVTLFYEVILLRLTASVAYAFFLPPCNTIISKVCESEKERTRGFVMFHLFFSVGFIVGPLLGSIILSDLGPEYGLIFQIASFVLVTGIVASLVISRKSIHEQREKFTFRSIKAAGSFPTILCVILFCSASFGTVYTTHPAYLDDQSIASSDIAILYLVFGLSRIVTLMIGASFSSGTGIISRYMISYKALLVTVATIVLGLLVSYMAESTVGFVSAMFLMGFGISIYLPLTLEMMLRKTKRYAAGMIVGVHEAIFGIGWAVGSIGSGLLSEFDNSFPYVILSVIGVGIIILVIVRRGTISKVEIR